MSPSHYSRRPPGRCLRWSIPVPITRGAHLAQWDCWGGFCPGNLSLGTLSSTSVSSLLFCQLLRDDNQSASPTPHPSICHTRRNTKILSQQSCLKAPLPRLQVRDRQLPTPPPCQTSSQNMNIFLQNLLSVSLFSVPQPLCLYRLRWVVNSGGKWFICHLLFCKSCTRRTSKCSTYFLHASTKTVIGNLNVLLNLLSSPFNPQDHFWILLLH